MTTLIKIEKMDNGLLNLDIDDSINEYEVIGILQMMIKRAEKEIICNEISTTNIIRLLK